MNPVLESKNKTSFHMYMCVCARACVCVFAHVCTCILAVLGIQLRALYMIDKYSTPEQQSKQLLTWRVCTQLTAGHMAMLIPIFHCKNKYHQLTDKNHYHLCNNRPQARDLLGWCCLNSSPCYSAFSSVLSSLHSMVCRSCRL